MKSQESNIGIVLAFNSYNSRITLFDKSLGKINLSLSHKLNLKNNLCNGALINYFLDQKSNQVKVSSVNIIDVPFFIAKQNLLFFHHVIELCNYFIPVGMSSLELFEMLFFALYSFQELNDLKKQKIFLTKFFLHAGTYPENEAVKSYIYQIMTIPIDSLSNTTIDLKEEKELSLWIAKCMNMHPYFKFFKTTNFLNKIILS